MDRYELRCSADLPCINLTKVASRCASSGESVTDIVSVMVLVKGRSSSLKEQDGRRGDL